MCDCTTCNREGQSEERLRLTTVDEKRLHLYLVYAYGSVCFRTLIVTYLMMLGLYLNSAKCDVCDDWRGVVVAGLARPKTLSLDI